MNKWIYAITLPAIAALNIAAMSHSTNTMRDAFTPLTPLKVDDDTLLSGTSDGDEVTAKISLDDKKALAAIKVTQDDTLLRLPKSAYANMKGAQQAWIEERGALTTLVIEGEDAGKSWRLALLFHPQQLRRKRLSVEGNRKDEMTFYSRDEDMQPSKVQIRKAHSRGFYNNN